jgi:hypothetical protein
LKLKRPPADSKSPHFHLSLPLRSCEPRNEKKKAWLQNIEGQA